MPYLFTCPHCQSRTEVDEAFSGQSGRCVVCDRPITLPDFAPTEHSEDAQLAAVDARSGTKSRRLLGPWTIAALLLLVFIGVGLWTLIRVGSTTAARLREGRIRLASQRNLEAIADALNAYASDHGTYPPPMTRNADGKPLHSWRVLLLPYLGEEELYRQINLDEPWNSEANQAIAYEPTPSVYRHPQTDSWMRETPYCLITGPGTLFPATGPLSPSRVVDGKDKTLLVAEANLQIQMTSWLEPVDLDVNGIAGSIGLRPGSDLGGVTDGGVCIATVDAKSHFLPQATPPMVVRALLTPAGQEPLADDVLDPR